MHCRACCLESLDCSQNRELRSLSCGFNPIKKIDLCHNTKIENLYVRRCKLEKLELRSLKNLQFLNCSENKLYEIQLYENKELIHLDCNCNDLHNDLYLGANTKLNYIDCYRNTCLDSITISEGQLIAEIRSQIKPMTESYRQYLLWKEYQAEKENDVDFYENERYYYDGWSKEDVESGLCDAYEDDLDARWNND